MLRKGKPRHHKGFPASQAELPHPLPQTEIRFSSNIKERLLYNTFLPTPDAFPSITICISATPSCPFPLFRHLPQGYRARSHALPQGPFPAAPETPLGPVQIPAFSGFRYPAATDSTGLSAQFRLKTQQNRPHIPRTRPYPTRITPLLRTGTHLTPFFCKLDISGCSRSPPSAPSYPSVPHFRPSAVPREHTLHNITDSPAGLPHASTKPSTTSTLFSTWAVEARSAGFRNFRAAFWKSGLSGIAEAPFSWFHIRSGPDRAAGNGVLGSTAASEIAIFWLFCSRRTASVFPAQRRQASAGSRR